MTKPVSVERPPPRNRHRPETKDEEALVLNHRDYRLLRYTKMWGPAPTELQFYIWRDDETTIGNFKWRMTRLFHGTKDLPPLFHRPRSLNPRHVVNAQAWNDITPAAETILRAQGIYPRYQHPQRDPLLHRGMGACIDISLFAHAKERGWEYVDEEAIFSRARCPDATRASKTPRRIPVGDGWLEPDRLFARRHLSKGYGFLGREDERGTETLETLKAKMRKYDQAIEERLFERYWGLPNFRPMFAVSKLGRMEHLIEYARELRHGHRFVFVCVPMFDTDDWEPPKRPIPALADGLFTTKGAFDLFPE